MTVIDEVVTILRTMMNKVESAQFQIRCRDISRGGVSFIHRQFIHPDAPVQIIFINGKREGSVVDGKIIRCRLIDKHFHEFGIRFNTPLELEQIAAMGLVRVEDLETTRAKMTQAVDTTGQTEFPDEQRTPVTDVGSQETLDENDSSAAA